MQKTFSFTLCLAAILLALFPLSQPGESTAQTTYTITATAGTGGTISPSGTVTVSEGASKTFSIIPDGDNSVADVLVDGISVGTPFSYPFNNVTSNHYIEAVFNLSAECTDFSSVPLSAIKHAAPPNIMFVLDDSGSMDLEVLTQEDSGKFQGYEYIFDNPGDNKYDDTCILPDADRRKWKSQWPGYNKLYYDHRREYEPWPTRGNADPDTPRSHPVNLTPTFSLNDTYYPFGYDAIIVDNLDGAPSYVETGGSWGESGFEPEYNGSGRTTNSVGSACFTPDLPEAGTYGVYAWWNCWGGRDQNAKITITYEAGTEIIYRNQGATENNVPECSNPSDPASPCCGHWVLLGSYPFAAGMAGSVTIERHAGSDQISTIADAVKFVPTSHGPVDIKNAHYYAFEDTDTNGQYDTGEPVYLVLIEGTGGTYTMRYFQATITGSDSTETVTDLVEVAEASVPESVKSGRTAAEERQNFANWYSFYRRRHFAATAAVANTIESMEAVNVGFYSINQSLIQTVLAVKVGEIDHTPELLDGLYNLSLVGDT